MAKPKEYRVDIHITLSDGNYGSIKIGTGMSSTDTNYSDMWKECGQEILRGYAIASQVRDKIIAKSKGGT